MSAQKAPVQDLYCVAIQRHPRDLGVSIVLPATCEVTARKEAFRLFPEYTHQIVMTRVSLVRYVELDWDASRFTIAQRERPPAIPTCLASALNLRKKPPRIKGKGADDGAAS